MKEEVPHTTKVEHQAPLKEVKALPRRVKLYMIKKYLHTDLV